MTVFVEIWYDKMEEISFTRQDIQCIISDYFHKEFEHIGKVQFGVKFRIKFIRIDLMSHGFLVCEPVLQTSISNQTSNFPNRQKILLVVFTT